MVFDFFRKRAEEGLDQLSNLATSAQEGNLGQGLKEAAQYTSETNSAFSDGLVKSRNKLLYDLDSLVNNEDFMDNLEDILLQADIGLKTADDVMEEIKDLKEESTDYFSRDDLRSILRGKLLENLELSEKNSSRALQFAPPGELTVIFVMGANGMGKTTSIGKLANRLRVEGNQKVMLAACDTFRAAAVDQLELWAQRANVTCFSPEIQGDSGFQTNAVKPSTILYGALEKAIDEGYDTLIVDTAGRLSNNDALTQELIKMKKVIQKRLSTERDKDNKPIPNMNVPQETLIVIDAAQGRVALDSTKQWNQDVGLTGLVLTKLDGSAKGGSVVAVSREVGLPVKLIGVGEKIDDLRDFEPQPFVDGLLGIGTGSKKDEGKDLENRLKAMRKARDDRAKQKPKTPEIMEEVPKEPITTPNTAGVSRKPNRKKAGKKKKKKR